MVANCIFSYPTGSSGADTLKKEAVFKRLLRVMFSITEMKLIKRSPAKRDQ